MKEPARWRKPNGGAAAEARALLLGDRGPAPSSAEVDRIWSKLEPQLSIVPSPTAAPPAGPAAVAGTGALVGKITLAVVLVTAVGAGVGLRGLHSRDHQNDGVRPEPANAIPPAEQSAASATVSPARIVAPAQPVATATRVPPATGKATRLKSRSPWPTPRVAKRPEAYPTAQAAESLVVARSPTNELLEEGRRLARARAALRAHDPDRALVLLETGAPGTPALAQEREALTIEALASKPVSHATAAERARTFMRTYPESPYRARIKAIVFENP